MQLPKKQVSFLNSLDDKENQRIKEVSDGFLKALQNDNKEEAKKWSNVLIDDGLGGQVIWSLGKPFQGNSTYRYTKTGFEVGASNKKVTLRGVVISETKGEKTFTLALDKSTGDWKVTEFGLNQLQ